MAESASDARLLGTGCTQGAAGQEKKSPATPRDCWASLTEQCWEYDECELFKNSFIAQGKAVFNVEYNTNPNCTRANQWHMNSSRRDLDLVGPTASGYLYQPCVPDTQATW